MSRWLKFLFFLLIVKPLVFIIIGLNIRGSNNLPQNGPAIIVANHNSHLDTLVLLSLFPLRDMHRIRPIAAGDYFLSNPLVAWLSTNLIGIIPISRQASKGLSNPLKPISQALNRGEIVIIFPEGSRGMPEKMQGLKQGVAHLATMHPDIPVIPIFIYGLGKALPKGEGLLVPFICDVYIESCIQLSDDNQTLMPSIRDKFSLLAKQAHIENWE